MNHIIGIGERYAHFHKRWIPRDMKSFMVSYEAATLLNTPATCDIISSEYVALCRGW
jgi:hypothetical protein